MWRRKRSTEASRRTLTELLEQLRGGAVTGRHGASSPATGRAHGYPATVEGDSEAPVSSSRGPSGVPGVPGVPGESNEFTAWTDSAAPSDAVARVDAAADQGPPSGDGVDAEILSEFLERLYVPVHRFVRARLNGFAEPDEAAADVAQDTLVRLARSAVTCRGRSDGEIIAWALQVARRVLITYCHAHATELLARRFTDDLRAAGVAVCFEESVGRVPPQDPGFELLLRMTVNAYSKASPSTAELFWLRLVGGAEWAEIARELVTTESAAKRRFQRAQATIRRTLVQWINGLCPEDQARVLRVLGRFEQP